MRSRYEFALAADGRKARWVIEMRIIADIMGGDNAPLETLRGVCQAAGEEYSRDQKNRGREFAGYRKI